jgi:hypothetical protein
VGALHRPHYDSPLYWPYHWLIRSNNYRYDTALSVHLAALHQHSLSLGRDCIINIRVGFTDPVTSVVHPSNDYLIAAFLRFYRRRVAL